MTSAGHTIATTATSEEALKSLYFRLRTTAFTAYFETTVIPKSGLSQQAFSQIFQETFVSLSHHRNSDLSPEEAFPELLAGHFIKKIYPQWKNGKCYRKWSRELADTHLAEQAYNDAFFSLQKALIQNDFQGKSKLESYFCTIFQRKVTALLNNIKDPFPALLPVEFEIDPEKQTLQLNRESILRRAAEYVGSDCLERLLMHHVDKLEHNEIAELLPGGHTPPQRLASNCRAKFRRYFCENTHLLSELGMYKVRELYERRKAAILAVANLLTPKCAKSLRLDRPCEFFVPQKRTKEAPSNDCEQEMAAVLHAHPEWEADIMGGI
ncbi:MAG: sigma-70 family RNA polymerase sigma factor [Saprospiraceae bacterium]|nr:sigma-70 family RNA polymerase sigma factor [Saprospiraceae bacterium]